MKRILRTLLAAVGILALVMVGAVIYVTTFFDPEDLKPRLIEVVREQSGLELTLEGPLSWSFYPRLGVRVEKAEAWLPDQEIEEETHFAAFNHAEVSLSFTPLLRGEIAIDGLTLDGLRLNLERDEQGRGNWEVLVERLSERSEEAEGALSPASAGPNPEGDAEEGRLAVALNIASVRLRDGEVRFRDLQANQEWRLDSLDIGGSNVNPSGPFPLEASFKAFLFDELDSEEQALEPQLESDVAFKSRVDLGLAEERYVLEDLNLTSATRLGEYVDEQQANLQSSEMIIDVAENRWQLEEAKLDVSLHHPRLGEKPMPLSLGFELDADLAEQVAQFRELELTGENGLELSGTLKVTELFDALSYSGQMNLAPLSLRPWLTRLDMLPNMASDSALGDVALTSPYEGDLERLDLTGLTLVLDDSTFTGRLGAAFDGESLDFDLEGDSLDLDTYLPPAEPNADTARVPSLPGIERAYAQPSGALVPDEWLAALDLEGELRLAELQLMDLEFLDVQLTLSGSDGRQRLVDFASSFYEGELAASGELDLREAPLRWSLSPRLSRVGLEPLLEALGEQSPPLRGRLSMDGDLGARGNVLAELKRSLSGNLAARLEEGAILETNVSQVLCSAVATLEGEQTSREWSEDTRFDRAEASFVIRDGTVESDDLTVTIPGIEVGGEGQLDIVSEQFDVRAAARFVNTADAACEVNPRLERVPFPVRCEGSLSGDNSEWCRFDRGALQDTLAEFLRNEASQRAGEEAEQRLEGALEGLDERIGEEAGGELRDALRGLFN
ncbi:AsmA family protein [Halomonas korlensis]|uniref:AsmA protein n=1 Tax=Halomonas korlensis TaxID=463301 RepID=A0A1I7J2U9_9GAMM|nr:AsmA family protein [Halomonas korlensis]SFU79536.1 AsmA protein [Halomonas korlensis]